MKTDDPIHDRAIMNLKSTKANDKIQRGWNYEKNCVKEISQGKGDKERQILQYTCEYIHEV